MSYDKVYTVIRAYTRRNMNEDRKCFLNYLHDKGFNISIIQNFSNEQGAVSTNNRLFLMKLFLHTCMQQYRLNLLQRVCNPLNFKTAYSNVRHITLGFSWEQFMWVKTATLFVLYHFFALSLAVSESLTYHCLCKDVHNPSVFCLNAIKWILCPAYFQNRMRWNLYQQGGHGARPHE
jgi:hypothetical protein